MAAITHEDVTKIVEIASKAVPSDLKIPESDRSALMKALAKLKISFQTPVEGTVEVAAGDMKDSMIRLAIDLGIFNAMAGGKHVQLSDLAASSKADAQLIFRIMRFLATTGVVTKMGPETWAPSSLAAAWVDGSPLRDILVHFQEMGQVTTKLPLYLRETKYHEPRDYHNGPFKYVYKHDFWKWLNQDPERSSTFSRFMIKNHLDNEEYWYEIYPTDNFTRIGGAPTRPLLVDVGGGLGFSIHSLKKHNPNLSGKLILQDLPDVMAEAEVRAQTTPSDYEGIELMPYNFFTTQPVRDARVYFLRTILHDWPDVSALQILGNIRAAMPPDALLLVNEWMMPEDDAPLFAVWMDMQMMTMFSSWERTHGQWLKLFDDAGFQVLQVYKPKQIGAGAGFVFELQAKRD